MPINVSSSSVNYSVHSGTVSAMFEQLGNLTLIAADGMAVTKGSNDKFILKDDDVNNKLLLQLQSLICDANDLLVTVLIYKSKL